ncbi:MAG: toprim domain-containing protein [Chitinophagaceae bacterium]|nr:toprim domain-containing protein [Chitinophagaceae bacterium]MCA6459285.1 toprim domain-containing protein [Chitinophagaceae bacterium]MCA6464655.1 toprim domain-containing protein [Chitinophagaceae bacterium]
MNCKEFNQLAIVDYLLALGHKPTKIQGNDYWYFSPFRNERTPSFKVNKKFNVWYDFGLSKGGNLIDFGILYYRCSVSELLDKLGQQNPFFFHPPFSYPKKKSFSQADEKGKIAITDIRNSIELRSLQEYLTFRKIPLHIANSFCREVDFLLYDKKITAIGFKNSAGGFELRSAHFKGSSSPKEVTLFGKDFSKTILVFEGFMDFLSYQSIHQRKLILLPKQQPNFLILNSVGFIERIKPGLEKYASVHLYLDRDNMGVSVTSELLSLGSKYQDKSQLYKDHKDLNEYLIKEYLDQSHSQRKGMRP